MKQGRQKGGKRKRMKGKETGRKEERKRGMGSKRVE
jgi:hypothetical protein